MTKTETHLKSALSSYKKLMSTQHFGLQVIKSLSTPEIFIHVKHAGN